MLKFNCVVAGYCALLFMAVSWPDAARASPVYDGKPHFFASGLGGHGSDCVRLLDVLEDPRSPAGRALLGSQMIGKLGKFYGNLSLEAQLRSVMAYKSLVAVPYFNGVYIVADETAPACAKKGCNGALVFPSLQFAPENVPFPINPATFISLSIWLDSSPIRRNKMAPRASDTIMSIYTERRRLMVFQTPLQVPDGGIERAVQLANSTLVITQNLPEVETCTK